MPTSPRSSRATPGTSPPWRIPARSAGSSGWRRSGAPPCSLDEKALRRERSLLGPILESFVAAEIGKQIGWSETRPALHHFRTRQGRDADLVLEDARGRVVGLEVKASGTVAASDLDGLRALAATAGKARVQGLVLYLGEAAVAFGPRLTACPVDTLWG